MKDHTPITHNFNPTILRPICVKLIQVDDHLKDITLYDAELYNGIHDGYCTNNPTTIDLDDVPTISTTQLYTSINYAQIDDDTNNIFHLDELVHDENNLRILKIQMNLNQQIDSGANKNVTNDTRILRNLSQIKSIPIFGVGNNEAACHITAKRITTLTATDGTILDIMM